MSANGSVYDFLMQNQAAVIDSIRDYHARTMDKHLPRDVHKELDHQQGLVLLMLHFAESIRYGQAEFFTSYVHWGSCVLRNRGISNSDLMLTLDAMDLVLRQHLDAAGIQLVSRYIQHARNELQNDKEDPPSYLQSDKPFYDIAWRYLSYLLRRDSENAIGILNEALGNGADIRELYLHVLQRTQYEIGRLWEMGKITIGQEHYCTALTQVNLSLLYEYSFREQRGPNGYRFLGICITNELHEMGIRMVCDFLEMDGWSTNYLGAVQSIDVFIAAIEKYRPHVVGISTSMTNQVSRVEYYIREVRKRFKAEEVKVIVGGHPFNLVSDVWQSIGADGAPKDAAQTVIFCKTLMSRGC